MLFNHLIREGSAKRQAYFLWACPPYYFVSCIFFSIIVRRGTTAIPFSSWKAKAIEHCYTMKYIVGTKYTQCSKLELYCMLKINTRPFDPENVNLLKSKIKGLFCSL